MIMTPPVLSRAGRGLFFSTSGMSPQLEATAPRNVPAAAPDSTPMPMRVEHASGFSTGRDMAAGGGGGSSWSGHLSSVRRPEPSGCKKELSTRPADPCNTHRFT